MTANRRSAQWPLGLVDTNGNRLNQARVIVNPRESHSRSFDQRLRARAPFTARNRRFFDSPLEGDGFEPSVPPGAVADIRITSRCGFTQVGRGARWARRAIRANAD